MKITRFLFPLLLLYGSISARGQFAVLPVIGPNISYSNTGESWTSEPFLGIKAGLLAGYNFSKNHGVQSGMLYSSYRFFKYNFRLNAIEIPLSVFWQSGDPERTRLTLGAGPYLGIQPNQEIKNSSGKATGMLVSSYTVPAYLGFGINAALELHQHFCVRAMYQPGLTNIASSQSTQLYLTQISVCFGFRIVLSADKDKPDATKE